jgi:hypothetical protein
MAIAGISWNWWLPKKRLQLTTRRLLQLEPASMAGRPCLTMRAAVERYSQLHGGQQLSRHPSGHADWSVSIATLRDESYARRGAAA